MAANPGQLRERVAFQRRRRATDAYGNTVTNDWGTFWCCAARIMPLRSGDERIDASRLSGFQPVTITVRACSALCGLIPDDRIVDCRNGRVYDIVSIANFDEHGQYLQMNATVRDTSPLASASASSGTSPDGTIDLSSGRVQPMLGGF